MNASQSAPTYDLIKAGQSPWLDFISRDLLNSGQLKSLIRDAGLLGVTSNPSIFEKAIGTSKGGYDAEIRTLSRAGKTTFQIYDALTLSDIQKACDLFAKVHEESRGEHGFVSLEVRPDLAQDEEATVREARRLYKAVSRPNIMIKVPATPEGVRAFRRLTELGINVNVTLIFSLSQYTQVLQAYLEGLEERLHQDLPLAGVHSVASVFVSRFDTLLDVKLAQLQERESDADERADLESLKGKAAVANSKVIYQEFKKVLDSERFAALRQAGATVQKLLWGSTSVKNPKYHDLMYVEPLVGRETVNTMPQNTLESLLDHGQVRAGTVEEGADEALKVVERLKEWGIDLEEVGQKLQQDGLSAFESSFDGLMKTLELACERFNGKAPAVKTRISVGEVIRKKAPVAAMERESYIERFFKCDASLWKQDKEHQQVINNRLGWLRVADWILGRLYELDELAAEVWNEKIRDVVLLGMGGSSLAPEVLSLICQRSAKGKGVRFYVLDTTDPAAILNVEKKIKLPKTLFLVSSKSGSTVETMSQFQFFYDRVSKLYARMPDRAQAAGRHFVAITDAGSRLESEGHQRHFRRVFINPSDVGGRYSALSLFGMVPAAILGIPVRELIKSARTLGAQCEAEKKIEKNTTVYVGALLGVLAREGCDKLTIWTTKSLTSFGAWLEQLVAESTGKEGHGILPVDGETPADPSVYRKDRAFLVLKLKGEDSKRFAAQVAAVRKAGFPVIEMEWPNRAAIGGEFLRWEIITAVTSSVMGVNPFDEPNVKESKDNTTRLLGEAEKEGEITDPEHLVKARGAISFPDFFEGLGDRHYVALLPYLERSPATLSFFARIQSLLRDALRVPVVVGFGPRYLHSSGQLYKGGPETGYYLFFRLQDPKDARIPHAKFTFSELKKAQATGDALAIADRQRPSLTIDLGRDLPGGLKIFEKQLREYLKSLKV